MCFGGGSSTPTQTAPAPPAPAPIAQAVTPLTGYQNETAGMPGYNAAGTPQLMRDSSVKNEGAGAGVGPTSGSGLGQM